MEVYVCRRATRLSLQFKPFERDWRLKREILPWNGHISDFDDCAKILFASQSVVWLYQWLTTCCHNALKVRYRKLPLMTLAVRLDEFSTVFRHSLVVWNEIKTSVLQTSLLLLCSRALSPCIHSLIYTLSGLGEFRTVMQEFSQPPSPPAPPPLSFYTRLCKYGKSALCCHKRILKNTRKS